MWYASSWSGTAIRTGVSSGCDLGTSIRKSCAGSSRSRMLLCPSVVSAMTDPPRAFASWMFPIIFSNTWSSRSDRHDRHLLVDERNRPVLHLAGRIALGMDVRNLLQLERALECNRIVDPAPEIQEITALVEPLRNFFRERLALERLLQQQRELHQPLDVRLGGLRRQRAANLAEIHREQVEGDDLRRERLGRGDADLRPGMGVDGAVGLARGHAADHVADRDAQGALLRASRSAASVSAVSPDCVMTTASVFFDTIGSR